MADILLVTVGPIKATIPISKLTVLSGGHHVRRELAILFAGQQSRLIAPVAGAGH